MFQKQLSNFHKEHNKKVDIHTQKSKTSHHYEQNEDLAVSTSFYHLKVIQLRNINHAMENAIMSLSDDLKLQKYKKASMQKTISSSCYDAIVIKQQNRTYRSTPFQVVFSSNLIKQIQKNRTKPKAQTYKLTLHVNDKPVQANIKIDQSGRIVFEKIYTRKGSTVVSDSSDVSDEQSCHKTSNLPIQEKGCKPTSKDVKIEEFKNEQAPSKFWQFAWLFNSKKEQSPTAQLNTEEDENNQSNLTKIKEEMYEGEEHSKQPLFHLSLCGNFLKKKETRRQILTAFYEHRVEYSQFIKDPTNFINDGNLVVKIDDSLYTWQLGIIILTCRFAYGRQLTKEEIEYIVKNKFTKSRFSSFITRGTNITKLDIAEQQKQVDEAKQKEELKKIKKTEKPVVKHKKTPDSDLIRKMKLKYGKNVAKFELDVGQGTKETITMKIFLWDYSQKIIISDIDGTITKSDILGQILNKWIHSGVTKLFDEIYKRHYKIIYLTARAIGQYQQTSKFLETVEEENIYLPQGPLLMSPDGYVRSFTRQIITKTPDYLKTKLLASLNELFPNTENPIYCGFGNRKTDSAAYLKINIAPDKIYCITEKSIISRESDKEFSSTYNDILTNINQFFPEYFKDDTMVVSESDEFNQSVQSFDIGKKTKSVDDGHLSSLEGYESDELLLIGDLSKSRKSEHEVKEEDLKALKDLIFEQKQDIQRIENEMWGYDSRLVKVKTSSSPPKSKQKVANNNQILSPDTLLTKQLQIIVIKELKQEKEISQNEVIPNTINYTDLENQSHDSGEYKKTDKANSDETKSKE